RVSYLSVSLVFSLILLSSLPILFLFLFTDPPTTEIYTLSLHDALPILKFTQDGKFLMQVGIKKQGLGPDSNSQDRFYLVAKVSLDNKNNEAYVADGYGNKRVVVIDMDTGKFKRYWGAYGNKPDDAAAAAAPRYTPGSTPSQQFRGPGWPISAKAATSPVSSTRCTASRSIRKATCTRPKRIRAVACRSSSTKGSRR